MRINRNWWWSLVALVPLAYAQYNHYFVPASQLSEAVEVQTNALVGSMPNAEAEPPPDAGADDSATLTADGPTHNNLSPEALRSNALTTNTGALNILTTHALASATFNTPHMEHYEDMNYQLHDPNAQKVMKYIVSCALDPEDSVSYTDPFRFKKGGHSNNPPTREGYYSDKPVTWKGELGLCGKRSPTKGSKWRDGAPSHECLELVSACIMARVNGLNRRVPLSIRGAPSQILALRDRHVRVEESYRENGGTQIASFKPCRSGVPKGPQQNCDWTPLYVGTCTDSKVTVGGGR